MSSGLPPQLKNFINKDIVFGKVAIGTTTVKTFTIKNSKHKNINYIVTRSTNTSPIYYVFDVNKYEARIAPGEEFLLKISYTPNVPKSKNFDYFKIIDTEENFYQLSLTGECIGPSVSCSAKYLNFFQFISKHTKVHKKQVVQLTNNSNVAAVFQFDCNEDDQGVFHVTPVKGTLKAREDTLITVTFIPQTTKFYHRQLWCLILYHEPIVINLLGAYFDRTAEKFSEKYFKYYPIPWDETVGYKGYLTDAVTLKSVPPPVSLSVNHLDFGRIMPHCICRTLTTSFTNHMEQKVDVEWEDVKFFQIYPEKLIVPPGKSALYELTFSPQVKDKLFSTIIHGHVSWISNEIDNNFNVPLSITLRLIGHSFPKDHSWIPTINIIPSTVILPLTLPGFPTWTSFMIKSEGHLPVLFKLLPPKKTNFIIKPMVGLVKTDFQIFVVQLEISNVDESISTSYVEKWNIELNGRVDTLMPIYIKAQTDRPKAVFGNENQIYFDSMQPGTQNYTYVPIKNASACHLQYECQATEFFGLDPARHQLAPFEETFGICWFSSNLDEEGQVTFEIPCKLQCIYNNEPIGNVQEQIIKVQAEGVYSELCAMPPTIHLGDMEFKSTVTKTFYLFNFGQSNINFKLLHNHNPDDVILHPIFSNCGPREKIMISVSFIVKSMGQQSLKILYKNRQNQFTEDVTGENPKVVFSIEYNCIYPTIQIVDLIEHNYGFLFNKMALWEIFKIDLINSALREVANDEQKVVQLSVPEGGISNDTFLLVFLIKNITTIDTKVIMKRRQICCCERKEISPSFTLRQKVFCCPHKDIFTMEISDTSIQADSYQNLTLKIKHILEYENILSYIFQLNNNRSVVLEITVNGIPRDEPKLSIFDKILNLGDIYVGLKEPPVLAFWIYNNTDYPSYYKLNDDKIIKLCNFEDFPVLKCLNPEGFVGPRISRPILFKFWPIEVKTYQVTVPLKLGSDQTTLKIIGRGIKDIDKCNFTNIMSMVVNFVKNGNITLSVDSIVIEPIMVCSYTERLFFIKNNNETSEIKYMWKPCFLDGLVRIVPLIGEGLLKPKESQMVVVKVRSLNEPCSIKLPFCCEFYDYTKWLKEGIVEKFYISLSITVNVIGVLDRDTCLAVEDQMKQKPFKGVHLDVDKFLKEYRRKLKIKDRPLKIGYPKVDPNEVSEELKIDKEITQFVLESVVGDAVFSNYFRETLNTLKHEPSPLYSQFKSGQKSKESVKLVNKPGLPEMSDICQKALIDGIHTTFLHQ